MPLGCRFMAGAACAARTARSAMSAPQTPSAQRFVAGAGCSRAAMLVSLHESASSWTSRMSRIQQLACRQTHCRDRSLFSGDENQRSCQHCAQRLSSQPWHTIVAGLLTCSAGSWLSAQLGWQLGRLQTWLRQGWAWRLDMQALRSGKVCTQVTVHKVRFRSLLE
jgi:hypothetical protein